MDLLTIIGQDTPLKKIASTGGGEWTGPCPFCGGRDRFRVQPERGRWWCRRCSGDERWEDAIAYLRRRDGIGFQEACRALGHDQQPQEKYGPPRPAERPLGRSEAPPCEWRTRANRAARVCEAQLWTPVAERARAWLEGRGLELETLRRWQIGYSTGQALEGLWLPRGIVLPWRVRDEMWQLKVRLPVIRPGQMKYTAVKGGRPYIYGVDGLLGQPVLVLAEGEFDTMLLWQEARHLADVASLGSCSGGATETILWELMPYRRILLAYDRDQGGEAGAMKLTSLSGRMRRILPPIGGDVTDFHIAGGSLSDWLSYHASQATAC